MQIKNEECYTVAEKEKFPSNLFYKNVDDIYEIGIKSGNFDHKPHHP